eukprot:512214-Prymnesium_polylepis.1
MAAASVEAARARFRVGSSSESAPHESSMTRAEGWATLGQVHTHTLVLSLPLPAHQRVDLEHIEVAVPHRNLLAVRVAQSVHELRNELEQQEEILISHCASQNGDRYFDAYLRFRLHRFRHAQRQRGAELEGMDPLCLCGNSQWGCLCSWLRSSRTMAGQCCPSLEQPLRRIVRVNTES